MTQVDMFEPVEAVKSEVKPVTTKSKAKGKKTSGKDKIFQMITDKIVEMLERGVVPWKKDWVSAGGEPRNLISNKPYRGINALLCSWAGNPYFLTYKQAQELGGTVKKGEKHTPIIFWCISFLIDGSWYNRGQLKKAGLSEGQAERKAFNLRYYQVYNVEQCEGLEHKRLKELKTLSDKVLKNRRTEEQAVTDFTTMIEPYKATLAGSVEFGGSRACYSPSIDTVKMPEQKTFRSDAGFISTYAHELVHSTGHSTRLDRLNNADCFHKESYGKEELVAEMGAGFFCSMVEVDNLESNASYIDNWIKTIKGEPSLVLGASKQAEKAVKYITECK